MKSRAMLWGAAMLCAILSLASNATRAEDLRPGKILTTVTISSTHSIQFVEYEPGVSVIIERRNADRDRQLIKSDNGQSLAHAYKSLRPSESPPESLRKADERAAARSKEFATMSEPLSSTHGNPSDPKASVKTAPPPPPKQTQLRGNWTDWTSDAQWFLKNFCNTGQNKWCPINVNGWAYSGAKYDTTWFQSTGFAQGFNSTAHFWVQYRSCSGWGPWYSCKWKIPSSNGSFTLQPRHLVTITWTSAGSRWAGIDQSSDRVGLAVLWNTAGAPPASSSNPGACNDPGEFCCSTYDQWGGTTFYCNGSVTCSGGICVTP